jgi:hypothetical protein
LHPECAGRRLRRIRRNASRTALNAAECTSLNANPSYVRESASAFEAEKGLTL